MLNKKEKYSIAIVGATGIVGESLLSILDSRNFPISSIAAIASEKSKNSKVKFGSQNFSDNTLQKKKKICVFPRFFLIYFTIMMKIS